MAKEVSFDNAAGKFVLYRLMEWCCLIDRPKKKYVSVGTNPSGQEQPGSTELTYSWLKYTSDRSKSCSATPISTSSSSASTPIPDNDYASENHSRYPDVLYWDAEKLIYSIVCEVKSKDVQPAEHQAKEQMFGLFRSHQKYMLGIIVKPSYVTIKILERNNKDLRMHTFPDMPVDDCSTQELLCKLIIAFIFVVDC